MIKFKLGDPSAAEEAMAQIKAMEYHQKYLHEGKRIILLGIGFDVEKRNVGSYLVETLPQRA